jgi:hypothetical protein
MWPRVVELMLGGWLVVSPFIFDRSAGPAACCVMLGGALVIALSLVSFWRPLGWAHFLSGAVAAWLIGLAYLGSPRPGPPAAQNGITTGLLLLLFFLLPNEANQPPPSWKALAPGGAEEPGS